MTHQKNLYLHPKRIYWNKYVKMPNKPYLEIYDSSRGGPNLKIYRQKDTYPGPPCCFFLQKNDRTLVYMDYYSYLCTTKEKCPEPEKYRQYFIQGHRESTRNSGLPLCGYGLFGDNPSGCTGGSPLLLTRNIIRPDRL